MCCCCTLFSCHNIMGFLSRSSSKKSKKSAKSESVYEQPSPARSRLSLQRSANDSPSRSIRRSTSEDVPEPLPAPACARVPCGDDIWARLITRDATSFYLDFADPHGNALDPALDVYDVGKPGTMTRLMPDFPLLTNPSPQTPTSSTDPSPKRVSKRSPLREQTLRERTLSTINRPDSTYFLNKYVNSSQASTPNLPSLPLDLPSCSVPYASSNPSTTRLSSSPTGRPSISTPGRPSVSPSRPSVSPSRPSISPSRPSTRPSTPTRQRPSLSNALPPPLDITHPRYILYPTSRYQIRRNADIVASVDFQVYFSMTGVSGAAIAGTARDGRIQESSVKQTWSAV
ncbi:hypothetical protein EV121DRAFT_264009 [Schizophyllum commune]